MLAFLEWIVIGAVIMYPLYFAATYGLAKSGFSPCLGGDILDSGQC